MSRSSSSAPQFPFSFATGCRLFFFEDPLSGLRRPSPYPRLREWSSEDVVGLSSASLCPPCSPCNGVQ